MVTLTKGQKYTDPMGNTGTVGFDAQTGKPLADGGTTTVPDTTITADSLAPVPEVKLPEPVPEVAPQEIINTATAESEVQKIADQAKTEKTTATSDISKLLSDIGVVQGKESGYATQAGADEARRLSDTYQSSIDIESRALKNYTDNLYKNPNLTTTLVNRFATEQTRKSASTIADLSVAKAVVDRDYDRAISIAEKKVEAELAPLKADLEAKKFIFDANIDLWTAGEKSVLDNIIKKEERAYDEQLKTKNDIEALKIEARKNGAPDSVINAMAKATTLDEALIAAGNYSSDPLDRAIKLAQLNKLRAEDTGAPEIKTINGVDMQWDGSSWQPITGETGKVVDTKSQLDFLTTTANEAKSLARASGRGAGRQAVGKFIFGATKSQQLEGLSNTLKTNILTMATDPNIKKFFGPQMTENDVKLMTSTGTTLNPDLQTPEQYGEEVDRILEMFNRAKIAVEQGLEADYINVVDNALKTNGTNLQASTYAQSLGVEPK